MPDQRNKPFLPEEKPFLCKLGIHRWGKSHLQTLVTPNIEEWEKRCQKCDEVKRWTKHKSYYFKQ